MKLRESVIMSAVLFWISLLTVSCGGYDKIFVSFENQSDESVFIVWTFREYDKLEVVLNSSYEFNALVQRGEVYKNVISPGSMEYSNYENLTLYVFKLSTMSQYSFEDLVKNEIYDMKYKLSISELEAMDFKIRYTGEIVPMNQ